MLGKLEIKFGTRKVLEYKEKMLINSGNKINNKVRRDKIQTETIEPCTNKQILLLITFKYP